MWTQGLLFHQGGTPVNFLTFFGVKMIQFNIWDFPEQMEVRFNDKFIQRIRDMTTEKEIKHPGDHRRQPHTFMKQVKLIGSGNDHPYQKIGSKLYAKHQWHGNGRNRLPHKPFINLKLFKLVHEITGIPQEEMQQNVISVRNNSSKLEIPMSFPVEPNEDWAWLFGIWFSAGGLITRKRVSKKTGYIQEESVVRLRVEQRVYEKKLKPLLERIAYSPEANDLYYIKKGMDHPLDQNKRKGCGNKPSKHMTLARPIREVMEKFGLPHKYPKQPNPGGKYATRKFQMIVPNWIVKNHDYMFAFVEGYMNGKGTRSETSHRKNKNHNFFWRYAEILFSGLILEQVEKIYSQFAEFLTKEEITGYKHSFRKHSKTNWIGYGIHKTESLHILFEKFDIQKPDLRARLTIMYFVNSLIIQVVKALDAQSTLVLGYLMDGTKTTEQITEDLRYREEITQEALQKLKKLDIALEIDGKWQVNPTGYRDNLVKELWKKELQRRKIMLAAQIGFFSRCDNCGNIIPRNHIGSCPCGGKITPIARSEVLKKYVKKRGPVIINRISKQEIPTFFGVKK